MLIRAPLSGAALSLALSACSAATPDPAASTAACGLAADKIGQFIAVPSGSFVKGERAVYPEEAPSLRLQVDAFEIQIHEVTNAQFAAFVDATGYVTDVEQGRADGRADAGSAVFEHAQPAEGDPPAWRLDAGANWRRPGGPDSSLEGRAAYPVVHVSLRDAKAYATWAGGRLASEVEWEYAATLGLPDPTDPTSGAYDGDTPKANTWQGVFPIVDNGRDGFRGAAPVGCFDPNRLGLSDMIGNVWEWTDTPFGAGTHTLKGGSFLCADNYCRRYRPAARHPQESDFSANHIGFRIVRDIASP
ncbi:MAG: formylglycine-generating enzyme family protein [Pseudomonadota bacterium]